MSTNPANESTHTATARRTPPLRTRAINMITSAGASIKMVTAAGMTQVKSLPRRTKSPLIDRLFTTKRPRSRNPVSRPIQTASSRTVPGPTRICDVSWSAAPKVGLGNLVFAIPSV